MKILVISNMYPSDKDPVYGIFVKNFYDYVKQRNHDGTTGLIAIKGHEQSTLIELLVYAWFYLKILASCIFKKWDLIYVHTITFPVIPLRIAALFRQLPLAFNIHGSDLITHSRLAEALKRKSFPLLRKAQLIVVPSTVFKRVLMDEVAGISEDVVYVSPSGGVDSQRFVPIPKQNRDEFVLGYVSHIIAQKGWKMFIDVVERLRQKGYPVKGIMAGNGSEENELIEMLKDDSYRGVVEYLGAVPQQELPQVYNKFDLFVFPTLFCESLGLVGLEAMSCGIPVVGSNKGGPTEYIKHEENGFMFEQGDADDLERQIERYLKMNQEMKDQMAAKSRETAMDFDKEKVLGDLYKKITSL